MQLILLSFLPVEEILSLIYMGVCLFTFVSMGKRMSLHFQAGLSIFTRTVQTLTICVANEDKVKYISPNSFNEN